MPANNGAEFIPSSHTGTHSEPLSLRPGFFMMDIYGAARIPGWTDGELWNGWSTPLFEYPYAMQLVELQNSVEPVNPEDRGRAWYDAEKDCFYFITEGTDQDVEEYPGIDRVAGGRIRRLYPVGTWYWTWEEPGEPQL